MADPNPIASTDDDNELLNTSDPYELSSHTAEFEELLSTQIKEAYSRNQSLQSELLEQVHQNLNSQIQSTILRLKENNQILTEIEEFQIICEDINQNYTQLSQIVVYKALGHHIARIEPRRYVEISQFLFEREAETDDMLVEAIDSAAQSNQSDVIVQLAAQHTQLTQNTTHRLQDQLINIINQEPEALTMDISHIFENNVETLVNRVSLEQLFISPLQIYLNLSIISNILNLSLEKLQKENDINKLFKQLSLVYRFSKKQGCFLLENIAPDRSQEFQTYITSELEKNKHNYNSDFLYSASVYCQDYPQFILEFYTNRLNNNQKVDNSHYSYFIEHLFIHENFTTLQWFLQEIKTLKNDAKLFNITVQKAIIKDFSSISLIQEIDFAHKFIIFEILINSLHKNPSELLRKQIQIILDEIVQEQTPTPEQEKLAINILKHFPVIHKEFPNQSQDILAKYLYLIVLQTSEFDINISKQYTILLNKLDFQNLPLPHQVTIDRLPTNYFEQSIESIDNFKEKFNQSSSNLKEIVEILQQIQLQKDPSFNFEGFEEEISKIYL